MSGARTTLDNWKRRIHSSDLFGFLACVLLSFSVYSIQRQARTDLVIGSPRPKRKEGADGGARASSSDAVSFINQALFFYRRKESCNGNTLSNKKSEYPPLCSTSCSHLPSSLIIVCSCPLKISLSFYIRKRFHEVVPPPTLSFG